MERTVKRIEGTFGLVLEVVNPEIPGGENIVAISCQDKKNQDNLVEQLLIA